MDRRLRLLFCEKGITLIELLVAMVVMIVIMTAAVSIFAPMYQAYQRANNLAEVNTLLDNISALIMDDVARATDISTVAAPVAGVGLPPNLPAEPATPTSPARPALTGLFRIRTTFFIDYYIDATGILWRNIPNWSSGDDEPLRLLPLHYYRFWGDGQTVFSVDNCELEVELHPVTGDPTGIVTLNLTIASTDGWIRDRLYTARPIGLAP
ncbi:MAG: prepilin-type N-terminal cleavage/methylation domain-containing protein [Oscillospiraceae bacterium]|nr:prepilin-type N-terminal cleavage/methylation domain-containing protein [Oscillospiraceae bacterium]